MTRNTNVPSKVHLGLFIYDSKLDCLLDSAGNSVNLRPQSAQVLSLLIDSLGQTVTKEHLISTVWANVSVTDDSLTQCIADIRRALGDTDRRILRTRPKIGYLLSPTQSTTDAPGVFAQVDPLAPKSIWVCVDGLSRDDKARLDQDAIDRSGGYLAHTTDRGVILSFSEISAALHFALHLCAGPHGQACRIGVDVMAAGQAERITASQLPVTKLSLLAQSAEIVASVEVRDLCQDQLDFDFEDLGARAAPESTDIFRVYSVSRNRGASLVLPDIAAEDLLPTIAIVPLRARISSPDTTVVGEIIADDLIATMSRSTDINVISRLSTTAFRAEAASLERIGDVLSADFVLSGTILTHDAQVGMILQLAEVSTKKVLWSERVAIEVASILNGLDAVEEIVGKIRKAIALNEIERVRSKPLSTLRNYTLLIGAVGLMHRLAPVDFNMAGEMLHTLIERSPNHPAALSWMARWHVLRVQQGWSENPREEAQLALACSTKALDIDPENALALTSEGFVLTNLLHKLDEAEHRYDAALEANPNDASGRLLRGTLFAFQGKGDVAKRDCERALHLAPIDPHRFFFLALAASASIAAEEYERAIVLANASLRLNRTHTSTLRVKAVAQMRLGNEESARETTRELLRLQPNLSVNAWLKDSPSANFDIGRSFAATLREMGVPE